MVGVIAVVIVTLTIIIVIVIAIREHFLSTMVIASVTIVRQPGLKQRA